MIKKLITLGIASLMTVMLMSAPSFADNVLLKVPVWFPTRLPALGTNGPWIAERINKIAATAGSGLQVKIYEPGKLIPGKEMLEAVSKGQVNAGYTTAGYNQGVLGAKGAIFSAVPFGPEASEYLAWTWYGNGDKLRQRTYDEAGFNLKTITCGIIAPETSGWFRDEIKKPSDLKGLRMRFFGLGAKVMAKLGVSPSQLPGGEIVPALEKKAIDAAEYSMPEMDTLLGINKILKYNYFPGWHQQATLFELIINNDTWNNEMNEGQRTIVELACKAVTADALALGEYNQFSVMKANEKAGTVLKYWNKKMLKAYSDGWDEVVAELSAEDPKFKEIWDDLTTFRANYAFWSEMAYMPRAGTKRVKK